MEAILQEIIIGLKEFESNYSGKIKGNTAWTLGLKKTFAEIGTKHQYKVCCSGFPGEYDNEWMYDLIWYKDASTKDDLYKPGLSEIPLVMESEWDLDFNAIKYDFEKLLLSNSKAKIMICQCHKNNLEKLKSYFSEAINKFLRRHEDELFLVSILDCDDEIFFGHFTFPETKEPFRLRNGS